MKTILIPTHQSKQIQQHEQATGMEEDAQESFAPLLQVHKMQMGI